MNACTVLLQSAYAFFGMCCRVASARAKPRRPSLQAQVRWLGMLFGELQDEVLFAILAFCMCISVKDPGPYVTAPPPGRGWTPRARYPGRKLPRFLADIRDDRYAADFSGAQLMRQMDQDRFATAEQFDRQTLLVRRYVCPAVTLSRVNTKLRNAITGQLNERTRLVKLHADGVCSWAAGVDLDAVRRLMEYAVGSVRVLGGAVELSVDDAKRLYRVLAQRWDVCDRRHLGIVLPLAYLPEGSLEVWRGDRQPRWRVWNGSRRVQANLLVVDVDEDVVVECDRSRIGMRHVFPVDFAEQYDRDAHAGFHRRTSPTDTATFFEHVLLADFGLAPKQVAALTTRGTTMQTNVVVTRLHRMVHVKSANGETVPALLWTELSCCFHFETTEAPVVVGDPVACTCDMSWNLVGDAGCGDLRRREVLVCEQARVLAVTGDFPDFRRGGFGDSWQRRILQKLDENRNAGAGLRFTALFGVCPIRMYSQHIDGVDSDDATESDA